MLVCHGFVTAQRQHNQQALMSGSNRPYSMQLWRFHIVMRYISVHALRSFPRLLRSCSSHIMYCLAAREDQTAQQRSEYSANILSLERLLPQPLLFRGKQYGARDKHIQQSSPNTCRIRSTEGSLGTGKLVGPGKGVLQADLTMDLVL